jgi:hypothetical protein
MTLALSAAPEGVPARQSHRKVRANARNGLPTGKLRRMPATAHEFASASAYKTGMR